MKTYKPVTLKGDNEHFYVGVYEDGVFRGLHSIHTSPTEAIDEADRMNQGGEEVVN